MLLIKFLLIALASFSGMNRLRSIRTRFQLTGKLQIHHVIPKTFRNYLRVLGIHENHPDNLILMPTHKGMQSMNLRASRIIHDGGHDSYNAYVQQLLKKANNTDDIRDIQVHLKKRIRNDDASLPWLR